MSLDKQKELLPKLQNMGESIPGLSIGPIIDNLLKSEDQFKVYTDLADSEKEDNIQRGMTKEEATKIAEEGINKLKEKYKESIKEFVNEKITEIKQEYKIFKETIKSLPVEISALIANIALPPAIPAGPNPLYSLNVVIQAKANLERIINSMVISFTTILKASNDLKFQIPNVVLSLFDKIAIIGRLLKSIPL